MGPETPEALALALAERKGLRVRTGTGAVQYLTGEFPHNVHRALRKLIGRWQAAHPSEHFDPGPRLQDTRYAPGAQAERRLM
jgi:hypothetical protein